MLKMKKKEKKKKGLFQHPTIRNSKIDSDRCCSLLGGKKPGRMKEYFHPHFSLLYI